MRVDAFDFDLPPERIALTPASPARQRADAGRRAPTARLTDAHVARPARFPAPRRCAGRQRHARHRRRGSMACASGATRAASIEATLIEPRRRVPVAGAGAAGQEAQARRAHPVRRGGRRARPACSRARRGSRGQGRGGRGSACASISPARRSTRRSNGLARRLCRPTSPRDARLATSDRADYQTMFAAKPGAVAAPTAGLHFTPSLIARIAARGVALHRVTLHVGAGTFLPVKVEDTRDHAMHAEWGSIERRDRRARSTACGTPAAASSASARPRCALLESAADEDGRASAVRRRDRYFHHARLSVPRRRRC